MMMMMMKTWSLPYLTDEKAWTRRAGHLEMRLFGEAKSISSHEYVIRWIDSLTMAVKGIRDRLKKTTWMKVLGEDIVQLAYVTNEAEVFTGLVSNYLEKDVGVIASGTRLTSQIAKVLQLMMFYLYLNPGEEIILSHLFKRIKYIIEKQRVWTTFHMQKQMVEVRQTTTFYFCDLPEEVLTILFCKGPLFRFELCSVIVMYGIFSKQPMLYGFIRAAESPVGQDGFVELFNRKDNDPLVIPNMKLTVLRDCFLSLPVSNTVQFHVKLHIKVVEDTYDDDDSYTDDDDDSYTDDYYNEVLTGDNDDDDDEDDDDDDDDALKKDMKAVAKQMKALMKKLSMEEPVSSYPDRRLYEVDDTALFADVMRRRENWKVKNEDEPYEVCNEYINISDYLAKGRNGCFGSYTTSGKDNAGLKLCYVALTNSVDAALEVEFVGEGKEGVGWIASSYGKGFEYGCILEKHLYSFTIFERRPDNPFVMKPGKVSLTRSVLPVPAQFSLVISAVLNTSEADVMLQGSYEFPVPCDGSTSFGYIVGNDCSLRLKVVWKLPFDPMLPI